MASTEVAVDKGLQSRWSFITMDENPTVAAKIKEKGMAMVDSLSAIGVCFTELKLKFLDLKRDINHKIQTHKKAKAKAKKPTIRQIKEAQGIRHFPIDSMNSLVGKGPMISLRDWSRSEPELVLGQFPLEAPSPPFAQQPVALSRGTNRDQGDRCFTSNPMLEWASRNPELHRQQVDTQHHRTFRQLAGPELFQSPIGENPTRILCTGPGTVSWAIDVATRYPKAEVLCLESEPFRRLMPSNCSVEVMDIRDYAPDDGWDLVYIRCTRAAVYWPRVLRRAQYITKIGGWVEMVDLERETPVCTCDKTKKCVTNWHCHICEIAPADQARQTYMQTSGFEDVRLITRLKGSVPNTYAVGATTLLGRLMERPSSPLSRHDSVMEGAI